jgi:hypothetical protein
MVMLSREETEPDRQATLYNSNGHPSLEISRKDAVVTVEGCPLRKASTRTIRSESLPSYQTLELRPAELENPT